MSAMKVGVVIKHPTPWLESLFSNYPNVETGYVKIRTISFNSLSHEDREPLNMENSDYIWVVLPVKLLCKPLDMHEFIHL
jgi:hypothetical protein